jgi:hypothetical protein
MKHGLNTDKDAIERRLAGAKETHQTVGVNRVRPTGEGAGRNTRGRVCSPIQLNRYGPGEGGLRGYAGYRAACLMMLLFCRIEIIFVDLKDFELLRHGFTQIKNEMRWRESIFGLTVQK